MRTVKQAKNRENSRYSITNNEDDEKYNDDDDYNDENDGDDDDSSRMMGIEKKELGRLERVRGGKRFREIKRESE